MLKYRELARILRTGGAVELGHGGRPSHRAWRYAVNGINVPCPPIPAHDDGSEVKPVYIRRLREAWKLTKEDGVSDADFLRGHWDRSPG